MLAPSLGRWTGLCLVTGLLTLSARPALTQNLQDSGLDLPGVWAGESVWGDYDGDGDADLILIGETAEADGTCLRIARVLRNDDGDLVEDVTQTGRLVGVYFGDLGLADYDSDGDLDLAVAGWDENGDESLRLYLSEPGADAGSQQFTFDVNQSDDSGFEGVRYADLAWGDVDRDGDLDLVVSGMDVLGASSTRLYTNDAGSLSADELNSEALLNVHSGELAWADYDSDGDLDLAVSGENVQGSIRRVTEFYRNGPTGSLALDDELSADTKVNGGALAWGDYDDDGNVDLAQSGRTEDWGTVLQLYLNKPAGTLTVDPTFSLNAFLRVDGSLDWVDFDNDGDLDLAASGRTVRSTRGAFVFRNDAGTISAVSSEPGVEGLAGGATVWGDYDGDGRVDLLLSGIDNDGSRRTVLYANSVAQSNQPPAAPTSLNKPVVASQRTLFSWPAAVDQESPVTSYNIRIGTEPEEGDILSAAVGVQPGNTGLRTSFTLQRPLLPDTYYWSVQAVDGGLARSSFTDGEFVVQDFVSSSQSLRGMQYSAMSWGDVDGDGDVDLALMGTNRSGDALLLPYINRDGALTPATDGDFTPLTQGDLAWGDYDGDGDLDLFTSGQIAQDDRHDILYRVSGTADDLSFEAIPFASGLDASSVAWGDMDNDGDLDLLQSGQSAVIDQASNVQLSFTVLLINDGSGGFADRGDEMVGLNNGDLVLGDVDGDGDLDLVVSGKSSSGERRTDLYRNGPDGLIDAGAGLPGVEASDLALGDYDRDGDDDLVIGGIATDDELITSLLDNDGSGLFTTNAEVRLPGIQAGDVTWADYDNDQDLDLILAGNVGQTSVLQIWENTIGQLALPDSAFALEPLTDLVGVDRAAIAMADPDGDGDLDLISSGRGAGGAPTTTVNDNLVAADNFPPSVPAGLDAEASGDTVSLSWQPASDDGQPPPPSESLSYNVRVGTGPGDHDVISGRGTFAPGNTGHGLSRRLNGLESGTYFWSVQTIDVGYTGSAFAAEQTFIIDTVAPEVSGFVLNKRQVGLGQTINLALEIADTHAGVDPDSALTVTADIGGELVPFSLLQYTGDAWSGELAVTESTPSGTATISIRGAVDRKGNVLTPFDAADAFVVDAVRPSILSRQPADQQEDVAAGPAATIVIGFSEPLDEATVLDANFSLRLGGILVPVSAGYDSASQTVAVAPESGLLPGSEYTVEVSSSLADLAGNRPADAESWTFRTRIPLVVATTPAGGGTDVAVGEGRIEAAFDTPILSLPLATPGAVQVLREGQSVELRETPLFDEESGILRFEPAEGLRPGSRYEVTLSGLLGGPLRAASDSGAYRWDFATSVPQVVSLSPADQDVTVAVGDAGIAVTFDGPVDDQALAADGSVAITREGVALSLRQAPAFDVDTNTLRFEPAEGLRPGSRYDVVLSGLLGGPVRAASDSSDYRWHFETGVPQIVSLSPADDDTTVAVDDAGIAITFDGPVDDQALAADGSVTITREGVALALREAPLFDAETSVLRFEPAEGLRPGSRYEVTLSGLLGGPLRALSDSGAYRWQFHTAVPQVTSLVPAETDTTVNAGTRELVATFDGRLDDESLAEAGAVRVFAEATEIPLATTAFDLDANTLTIVPTGGLRPGTSYRVQIAADVLGPLAAAGISWAFSTETPQVVATDPADGTSIGAGNLRIQVQFSSAIAEENLLPRYFSLSQAGRPLTLAADEFLYDVETFAASLPAVEFVSGSSYRLVVSSRIGGPRAQGADTDISFTTDIPTVVGTVPDAGAEGISTGQSTLQATFSGRIARRDGTGFSLRARSLVDVLTEGDEAVFQVIPIAGFGTDSTLTVVSFSPEGGLQDFTEYEISIGSRVFGDLGEDGFTWRFSTAARLADAAAGGIVTNPDRAVELYLPPNALAANATEIRISPVATAAGKPAALAQDNVQVGRSFRIDAGDVTLRKPATLTLRYTETELGIADPARLGIFVLSGTTWSRVGGTANPADQSVRTTVSELGVFALFEDLSVAVGSVGLSAVDCQPRAFGPAGGDLRDETDISFELSGPADVTVRVYNAAGRLERVVVRDRPMAPGRNSLPWNGRDEDSEVVASGLYVVVVSAGSAQAEKVVAVVR